MAGQILGKLIHNIMTPIAALRVGDYLVQGHCICSLKLHITLVETAEYIKPFTASIRKWVALLVAQQVDCLQVLTVTLQLCLTQDRTGPGNKKVHRSEVI